MAREDFDCIVIGAGPAGSTAAYVLAKNNLKVCLVEKGDFPGSKNLMGGVLYSYPTCDILPDFYKEAPLERPIVEKQIWMMKSSSTLKFAFRDKSFGQEPYNSFSVLRAKFDKWFAEKVDEAGVFVIPKTTVTDLVKEGGAYVGIKTDRPDGDLKAKVLVLAEGANPLLALKAGLCSPLDPKKVALSVKQILFLPEEKINERFNVGKEEGIAVEMLGDITEGMVGTGFLYTNKNTISLGVGAIIADFVKQRIKPYELIERLKENPSIIPLIKDGVVREYAAHMIPEGGYNGIGQLYDEGILVVGDTLGLVNPIHGEGSNLAMISGKLAAETVVEAAKKNDFSKSGLASYRQKLYDSLVIKDLHKYKDALGYFEDNQSIMDNYMSWAASSAKEILSVNGQTKKEKQKKIIRNLYASRGRAKVIKDAFKLWRIFK